MFPKVFSIGDYFLPTYGLLVALGFLAALWMSVRLARRAGLNPEAVTNLGVYCAIAGLLGAKLMMILFDLGHYAANPGELISRATLQAAGVFHGGLILALLTGILYMRNRGLPAWTTADVFAPGIALGHAIGRLGCFAAGCCWGAACSRPWAVTFTNPAAHELTGVPLGEPLHPAQLYEAFAEAMIFGFLYWRFHRPHRSGEIIGWYLLLYSAARFLVEFVRSHEQALPFGGPFSNTQWIALALLGVGTWLIRRNAPQFVPAVLAPKARA
jgi:phosphatidylglycerol:prolipoprotein diacylglycerol transferase